MSESPPTEPPEQSEEENENGEEAQADLAARVELLTEENRRLRQQYASTQRTRYRGTALGLGGVGLIVALGGVLFPQARSVLFILGAIGIFGGLLTYYLTPERFVAADIGERVYSALARNEARLTAELGLTDVRVYLPADGEQPAWLYIPQYENYDYPSAEELDSLFVIGENERSRGVSLAPTGGELFREFEQSLTGTLATTPDELAPQLIDGLLDGFELIQWAESELDSDNGRLSIRIENSAYGGGNSFDEPTASFIAVALAQSLEQPVRTETTGHGSSEYTVTCYWDPDRTSNSSAGNSQQPVSRDEPA